MSSYRESAREVVPKAAVPDLPDAACLRSRATNGLATRLAIGAGTVGWLAVAPLTRILRIDDFDGHVPREPLAPRDLLVLGAPALFTTALLTFLLVRLAVGRSAPRALFLTVVLGGVNGSAYFAVHGLLEGGPGEAIAGAFAGLPALFVSAPLGFAFGIVLVPFVASATDALEKPSQGARAHVLALGAGLLAIAAPVAGVLAARYGAELVVATAGTLAVLAIATATEAVLRARALRRVCAAVTADRHPSLVAVPIDDATIPSALAPLDALGATPRHAVVARRDVDADPKPVALTLVAREAT